MIVSLAPSTENIHKIKWNYPPLSKCVEKTDLQDRSVIPHEYPREEGHELPKHCQALLACRHYR